MKMAKASEADLAMAMELCEAFDSLTQRWGAYVPNKIAKLQGDDEFEPFDEDDAEQNRRVLKYLIDIAERASLMRVVFGMTVLLDPRNKIVDPDADTLEHHPDTVAALAAMSGATQQQEQSK